jgi:phosphoglycolate phosphatase-like HAD superfamily hydrolase
MSTDFYLLFDIDGTLMLTGNAGSRALKRALSSAFAQDRAPDVPFGGRTDKFILKELLLGSGIEPNDENFLRLRQAYINHLPQTLMEGQGSVLPGVLPLLSALRQQVHVHVGLLTGNLPEAAQIKLGHFGLQDFFSFGVFGDHSHDRRDLASEASLLIRRKHGDHHPKRVCVIGDTEQDVWCAQHIDARVLACCTGAGTRQSLLDAGADLVLDSLANTSQVLAWLLDVNE